MSKRAYLCITGGEAREVKAVSPAEAAREFVRHLNFIGKTIIDVSEVDDDGNQKGGWTKVSI